MYRFSMTSMQSAAISSAEVSPLLRLRSYSYALLVALLTLVMAPLMCALGPLPYRWRDAMANLWVRVTLWGVRVLCGLRYEVSGSGHIPEGGGVIFCKHQSEWETIALQMLFRPVTFVLKKEILSWPFFGWAMATLDPIAIDRSQKTTALRQVLSEGAQRLAQGRWVCIFPEGTRVAPGRRGNYNASAALLAIRAGRPILPVAHNAGEFWGTKTLLKRPGTIQMRIGPPIWPKGRKADELTRIAAEWVEGQMAEISTVAPVADAALPDEPAKSQA